jgi:6-phosphogluconolactonase (cycloisomerase 2 family)
MPMLSIRRIRWVVALACACLLTGLAQAATQPHYVVTNDDVAPLLGFGVGSYTFYTVGANGSLKMNQEVLTSNSGIGGGYFGSSRLAVLNNGDSQCVYASEAAVGDIVGILVDTLQVGGTAFGSETDQGTSNGIGLVMNNQYLYASFSDSNTIGTFQVQPGCSLTFVNDVSVAGLQTGVVEGMALSGNTLVVTYGDGSIESFNVSNGTPVSNGDAQNSTGALAAAFATYPTSVEITQDGHYALFGDTSTSNVIEVSDISSGKLAKTVPYNLGHAINSSSILLSPDETMLYVSNTQGDKVSAAFFNSSTGQLTYGCSSGSLKGYVSNFSYLGSLALETNTGTGSVLYAAEYGTVSGIATVNVSVSSGTCTLTETASSPVNDPDSSGLLSIAAFPPRSF